MKLLFASVMLLFVCLFVKAQYVSRVIEYLPAPGQVINTVAGGSINAAGSVVDSYDGLVSLGAFGGHVIYGFDQPVENDPANPYGVDFIVFGNAQTDWSEPGIVMVMKDENLNGKADDQWFELAGSDYFFSTTKKDFEVTYFNPEDSSAEDVQWSSNDSASGYVFTNSYHQQPYYPDQGYFPEISNEYLSFKGTKIDDYIDVSNPGMVKNYERRFGYADNHIKLNSDFSIPDNPYTIEQEGCGGDPMDISWAIDVDGNYIDIDRIDFVKVYTGVLANGGWLGEISTEISAIVDIPSNSLITGIDDCIVIKDIPLKLLSNDSINLEGFAFKDGRFDRNEKIVWESENKNVASVNEDGKLLTHNSGTTLLKASFLNNNYISETSRIEIVTPTSLEINIATEFIRTGDQTEISGKVLDENHKVIGNIETEWEVENSNVISVIEKNGKTLLYGISEGESNLALKIKGAGNPMTSIGITVLSASENKEFYISVKDENSIIFPRKKVSAVNFNLNPYVDRTTNDYGIKSVSSVTLAHAIAQTFIDEGFESEFRFRDDEMGNNNLYLWKVPNGDESNMEYIYGYGGSTSTEAFSKSWIAVLNNKQIVNDFNNYHLKNGDEIIIYHQDDITEEWTVTNFYSDKSEVELNEDIETYSSETNCKYSEDRKVEVTETTPIQNCQIWINNEAAYLNGSKVKTDENGKAVMFFNEPGMKFVSNGIDQMIINVSGFVSSNRPADINEMRVWPMPADSYLQISTGKDLINSIEIIDLTGRIVYIADNLSSIRLSINISTITRGSYILRVKTGERAINKKVMIQ